MLQLDLKASNSHPFPGPTGGANPIRLLWAIANICGYLETMTQRYGSIYVDHLPGFPPAVIISDPEAIEAVFTANPNLFDASSGNQALQPIVGETSLMMKNNEPHARRRKLLMPPFHGDRLRAYGRLICDITQQVMQQRTADQRFLGQVAMQDIALKVILRAVFGLQEGQRLQQIQQILVTMLDFFSTPLNATFLFFKVLQQDLGPWSPWGRLMQDRRQLDTLLYQEIRERQAHPDPQRDDILSLLLSARDEEGQALSDVELRDELMALLFAGNETTATSMTWALHWIHFVPDVRTKLLAELSTLNCAEADPTTIAQLPYLSAVCAETLRVYPAAFFTFGRILQTPMVLMGQTIPPGYMLTPCIYSLHHRSDLYPDPLQFRPERFLERQFSPYEYIPFGGGNRRCIGSAFALFEMKLVLATILSQYSLSLAENRPLQPRRRGVVFVPEGGVPMIVNQRVEKR